MKYVSAIMLTLGTAAGLLSASATPSDDAQKEIAVNNNAAPMAARVQSAQDNSGAIKIIAPHHDLESAIRSSEKGDILLLGAEGWYRLESKVFQEGTRVYVLSKQGAPIAMFPKEGETVR